MITRQLELGLESRLGMRLRHRNRHRSDQARWWFEKMRGVVAEARDWPPAVPPPVAPRSIAPPMASGTFLPGAPSRSTTPAQPASDANASPTPGGYRWHFRRTHHLTWE